MQTSHREVNWGKKSAKTPVACESARVVSAVVLFYRGAEEYADEVCTHCMLLGWMEGLQVAEFG